MSSVPAPRSMSLRPVPTLKPRRYPHAWGDATTCEGIAPFVSSSARVSLLVSRPVANAPPLTMPVMFRSPEGGVTAGAMGLLLARWVSLVRCRQGLRLS